ncbi:MAG: DUF2760 domain-containing protein [Giesbergeria sp.]|uniref:DUF2760 domain-containing protein n=1 Tax=Giesbergeria sp. TaxID=2818473 RepID=UPI00263834E0|nr:DUF2760 domain-containing protein [Giesbergeria sp.]MDD2608510.1 DUF2760 domain-containing protein [Giesbergeria sp.]
MTTQKPPCLMRRIALAISSFFSIIAQPEFAARVAQLRDGVSAPPVPPAPVAEPPVSAPAPVAPVWQAPPETAALQLLGLLQREARFVDFIEQDVAAFSDADIGGAARVVHEGCRKVLREHFTLASVRTEAEGSRITLPAGFDASAVRVTGNVVGQPPFTGTLVHQGWRVTDSRLPQLAQGHDARVLAAAEVEL